MGFRTRVYDWMSNNYGLRFTNRFYGLFSSVFAALTRGWTKPLFKQPTGKIFQRALKAKNIKRVVEVGPGADSMLLKMSDVFREAGCKMFVIGAGNSERYRYTGIKRIPGWAGELSPELRGNFDLVIAHNVFSFGGHGFSGGLGEGATRKAINNATNGTLDLIKRLSHNKDATIVLTEDWDALLVDRKKIEQHARIIRWEPWLTEMGVRLRDPENVKREERIGWINQNEARVMREAPNLIVLRKKPTTKAKK